VLLLAPPPATPAANLTEVRSLSEIQRRPAIFFADLMMTIFADLFDRTRIEDCCSGEGAEMNLATVGVLDLVA
jgi:hypothetical protein